MAEDNKQTAAPTEKPRRSLKTLLIVGAVVIIEGVAIGGAFLLAGQPADVRAEGAAETAAAIAEQPVEELVVAEKFQNTRSGRPYLYDTEIYIVIRRKHQSAVKRDLESMQAAVSTDIATIFRRAEPSQLSEPTLATLTRQIKAALDTRLQKDEEGQSVVEEVLVRKCTQLPMF